MQANNKVIVSKQCQFVPSIKQTNIAIGYHDFNPAYSQQQAPINCKITLSKKLRATEQMCHPFCMIGLFTNNDEDVHRPFPGCLIGPSHILTSSQKACCINNSTQFQIEIQNETQVKKVSSRIKLTIDESQQNKYNVNLPQPNEVTVIELEEPLGQIYGYLGLVACQDYSKSYLDQFDYNDKKQPVLTVGYKIQQLQEYQQYYTNHFISDETFQQFRLQADDVSDLQEGSFTIAYDSTFGYCVIGVSMEDNNKQSNQNNLTLCTKLENILMQMMHYYSISSSLNPLMYFNHNAQALQLHEIDTPKKSTNCICRINHRLLASGGSDKVVRVYNYQNQSLFQQYQTNGIIRDIIAEGPCIFATSDDTLIIINWEKEDILQVIETETSLYSLHLLNNSTLICGDTKGNILFFTINTINYYQATQQAHSQPIVQLKTQIGCSETNFNGHSKFIQSLCSITENIVVSGSGDGLIKLWKWQENTLLKSLQGHEKFKSIYCLQYDSQLEMLISSSSDQTVRFWDVLKGQQLMMLKFNSRVYTICLLQYSKELLLGNGNQIISLKIDQINKTEKLESQQIKFPTRHCSAVKSIKKLRDNLLVSCDEGGKINLWGHSEQICMVQTTKQIESILSIVQKKNDIIDYDEENPQVYVDQSQINQQILLDKSVCGQKLNTEENLLIQQYQSAKTIIENESLKREVEKLNDSVFEKEILIQKWNENCENFSADLQVQREKEKELKQQIEDMNIQITEHNQKLEQVEGKYKNALEENEFLHKKEIEILKSQNERIINEQSRKYEENTKIITQNYERQINQLKINFEQELENQQIKNQNKVEELNQQIQQLIYQAQQQLNQHQEQLQRITQKQENDIEDLKVELQEKLTNQCEIKEKLFDQKYKEIIQEVEILKTKNKDLKKQAADQVEIAIQKEQSIVNLTKQINDSQNQLKQINQEWKQTENEFKLKSQIIQQENDEMRDKLACIDQEKESYKQEIEQHKETIATLKREREGAIGELNKEKEDFKLFQSKYLNQYDLINVENEQLRNKAQFLTSEFDQIYQEQQVKVIDLQMQLHQFQVQQSEQQTNLIQYQKQIQDYNQQQQQLQQQNQQLQQQSQQLQQQVTFYQNLANSIEQEMLTARKTYYQQLEQNEILQDKQKNQISQQEVKIKDFEMQLEKNLSVISKLNYQKDALEQKLNEQIQQLISMNKQSVLQQQLFNFKKNLLIDEQTQTVSQGQEFYKEKQQTKQYPQQFNLQALDKSQEKIEPPQQLIFQKQNNQTNTTPSKKCNNENIDQFHTPNIQALPDLSNRRQVLQQNMSNIEKKKVELSGMISSLIKKSENLQKVYAMQGNTQQCKTEASQVNLREKHLINEVSPSEQDLMSNVNQSKTSRTNLRLNKSSNSILSFNNTKNTGLLNLSQLSNFELNEEFDEKDLSFLSRKTTKSPGFNQGKVQRPRHALQERTEKLNVSVNSRKGQYKANNFIGNNIF